MATALLSAIGVLVLALLVYVIGLAVVRRTLGERYQNLYNAFGQAALAIAFDFVVIYFSVSFCTASIKYALRIRGGASPNQVLDSVMKSFGGSGLDNPTLFGLVIPAVSWVVAHIVILGLLLTARYVYAAVQAHVGGGNDERGAEPGAALDWLRAAGAAAVSGAFIYFFSWVVGLDALLLRYQIISNSRALKTLLGTGWEARLSQADLVQKLGHTFVGQIVIHVGAFYVITLLVAAFVIVIALHNLFATIRRLPPGRRYTTTAPLLVPIAPDDRDYGIVGGGAVVDNLEPAAAAVPPAPADPDGGGGGDDTPPAPPADGPEVVDLPPAE